MGSVSRVTTNIDRHLLDVLDDYIAAGADALVEIIVEREQIHDDQGLVAVGMRVGLQFGLELSRLDPTVAQALLNALHGSQDHIYAEQHSAAQIFLDLTRARES